MPLSVRPATADDAQIVAEFNRLLAFESENKVLDPAVLARGVAAVLADRHKGRYFVAEVGGEVVGQLCITFEFSDWRDGWIWWIQSVYVRADHRRRGVFRALHRHIRAQARAAIDVIGLRLYVEAANDHAQRTYQALGFTPGGYHVYEDLWPERFGGDRTG